MVSSWSLCVGLNTVDPVYQLPPLEGADNDRAHMARIAARAGFDAQHSLAARQATREGILSGIAAAAQQVRSGGLVLFSFAGHGGQTDDPDGQTADAFDEVFYAWDGPLFDDELKAAWRQFNTEVRIVVVADTCFSGSITALVSRVQRETPGPQPRTRAASRLGRTRFVPQSIVRNHVFSRQALYARRLRRARRRLEASSLKASVMLLAACQESALSFERDRHGVFTRALLRRWNEGRYRGGYRAFLSDIANDVSAFQTPNYLIQPQPNPGFENQRPFTV